MSPVAVSIISVISVAMLGFFLIVKKKDVEHSQKFCR